MPKASQTKKKAADKDVTFFEQAGADGTGTPDYKMYSTHSYPAKDAKFASAVHDWVGKSTPKHGWSFGTDSFLLRRLADESVNARLQAFSKGQGGF